MLKIVKASHTQSVRNTNNLKPPNSFSSCLISGNQFVLFWMIFCWVSRHSFSLSSVSVSLCSRMETVCKTKWKLLLSYWQGHTAHCTLNKMLNSQEYFEVFLGWNSSVSIPAGQSPAWLQRGAIEDSGHKALLQTTASTHFSTGTFRLDSAFPFLDRFMRHQTLESHQTHFC